MPRWDYKCPVCSKVSEIDYPGPVPNHRLIVHCKACPGRPEMERLPSAPSFVVKGYNSKNGYSK